MEIDEQTPLGRRLGIENLDRFIDADLVPVLEEGADAQSAQDQDVLLGKLRSTFTLAFFAFIVAFMPFFVFLPDVWWGNIGRFLVFPVLFFGAFIIAAWFRRDLLVQFFMKAETNFLVRAEALQKVARAVGITYVPSPGGAPEALKVLAKLNFVPKRLSQLTDTLDEHGGMDDVVRAAVESGLLVGDTVVLGNDEQKARFYRQSALGIAFEDGFEGARNGLRFSAFEWLEDVDEGEDRYHLLIALKPPQRLHGVTQLRSRKTPWPNAPEAQSLSAVELVPDTFNRQMRLRSSDQVEARTIFNPAVVERVLKLAHDMPFRAVAAGNFLILDIVGDNRFSVIELATGKWSRQRIEDALRDVAELLELVDEAAHTFMIR